MKISFQTEVKLMYRQILKILYKKPPEKTQILLDKVRNDFKTGAKISRKDMISIDYAFHNAQRLLSTLQNSSIDGYSTYVPKSTRK
jgi:hypothetical protein